MCGVPGPCNSRRVQSAGTSTRRHTIELTPSSQTFISTSGSPSKATGAGFFFLQGVLRPALHPAGLPPAAPLGPGTPHIVMLSYFSTADGGVLSIAGLWDEWREGNSPLRLLSCKMIVTEANEFAGNGTTACRCFLPRTASRHGSTVPPAPSFCVPLLKICCICSQYQGASIAPPTASMIRRFSIPLNCRRLEAL
jgi:hypothetical protein